MAYRITYTPLIITGRNTREKKKENKFSMYYKMGAKQIALISTRYTIGGESNNRGVIAQMHR
jgi:hypothetical protein